MINLQDWALEVYSSLVLINELLSGLLLVWPCNLELFLDLICVDIVGGVSPSSSIVVVMTFAS